MKFSTLHKNNRQDGLALVMAIGFLLILSILGAVVMNVSMNSLSQTSDTLPNQRSFYAADRSVEYAMNRDIIVNLNVAGTVDLKNDEVKLATGAGAGVTHKVVIDASGPGELLEGSVTDVGPRSLPPHLAAVHGSEFGANLYHVNVKTTAPAGKTTHVDASIVRLFKMDDDQIFRTSGGG